jgi:glutathione S-transferase
LKLIWVSGSPYSWRALLALLVKQIPFESRMLREEDGGLNAPELRSVNPRGAVPTLLDGGLVLTDSIGILAYLDRKQPRPALFGNTAREAGNIWDEVCAFTNHMEPHSKAIVKSFYAGKAEERRAEIASVAAIVRDELDRIDCVIGNGPWVIGEQLTAADLVIYPFLKSLFRAAARPEAQSHELGLLPADRRYPSIAAWMAQVEALPGYALTYPPDWAS